MTEIREATTDDIERILEIWLEASLSAHDFVAPDFWHALVADMRDIYLPAAEVYLCTENANITGFYALKDNCLAALFVAPAYQGQGHGRCLLAHAKSRRSELSLNVYKSNEGAWRFYQMHGFELIREQQDMHTGHQEYVMELINLNDPEESDR